MLIAHLPRAGALTAANGLLLIVDVWRLEPLTQPQRSDLMEIRDDRLMHNAHRLNLKNV